MSKLVPFPFDSEHMVRVVTIDGEPWFVAMDVCNCLGLSNSRMAVLVLDEDERADVSLTYVSSNGVEQNRDFTIVSESGLYALILRSRKAMTPGTPQHRFRRWVTSDLIPSVRKTGGYGQEAYAMTTEIGSHLSLTDLYLTIDDEPRIKDVRIGERLGMAQPLNIRQVIEANREELERYGPFHAVREMVEIGSGAKREVLSYYLNEAQTLLLCMLSRTERAADVRQEVITTYMAYRRGELPMEATPTIRDGRNLPPGQRFAEERLRLGYATRKEFAEATGLKIAHIAIFEDLNNTTKKLAIWLTLLDIGFDLRYWQSGIHTPYRPVSPQESALLQAWRRGDAQAAHRLFSTAPKAALAAPLRGAITVDED